MSISQCNGFYHVGFTVTSTSITEERVTDIQSLKTLLMEAWNNIPLEVVQRATGSWLDRLSHCAAAQGKHFEHHI